MPINKEAGTPPPPMIGKIGPYTVFVTPPATPKPSEPLVESPMKKLSPIKTRVQSPSPSPSVQLPVQSPPPPPPVQVPPSLYKVPAPGNDSSFGFFWNAVAKVQNVNGGSSSSQPAVEKLVGDNYSYWRECMEAYLQGQDLSELVSGAETVIPEDTPQIASSDGSLCSEVSELDSEEPISDARLRRYLIRGLRQEFMPFISSVQGWVNQPTIIELENLLSNQEALVKQMSSKLLSQGENILFTRDQGKNNSPSKHVSNEDKQFGNEGETRSSPRTCYRCGKEGHFKRDCHVYTCSRCGKLGHIKSNCRVKLRGEDANAAHETEESGSPKWEQCFSIEVIDQPEDMASTVHPTDVAGSIDYKKEWIIDSGCSHHATGDAKLLADVRPHEGKRVIVTADNSLHPVMKEGNFNVDGECVSLKNVYHVEVSFACHECRNSYKRLLRAYSRILVPILKGYV